MIVMLRNIGARPLLIAAGVVALAALLASGLAAVLAESGHAISVESGHAIPIPAPGDPELEATITSRVRQLTVLKGNIHRWGCDLPRYATSVEGCVQLNTQARELDAELQGLKARAGAYWTSKKQAAAEASARQGAPPPPKPYTFRTRTNPAQSYRTVCVRLCDGFYFPISEATQPQGFITDEKKCQSRCAAPAKLFYQGASGDEAADMVALTGERYTELANAFRYRREYDDACACKPLPWSAEATAEYEHRAIIAARTPLQRIVAAGAKEAGMLLAGGESAVAATDARAGGNDVKVGVASSKARYSRSAPDKTRAKTRVRTLRYSADLPAAGRSQSAAPEQPQRRCFLFCKR
jgi:hypothetical protein